MRRRRISREHWAHAIRVAAVAALVVAVVAVALGAALDLLVSRRLTFQVSRQTIARVDAALHEPRSVTASAVGASAITVAAGGAIGGQFGLGIYGAPIFLWRVSSRGGTMAASPGAPSLRPGRWPRTGATRTVLLGATAFLVASTPYGTGWMIAGESLAERSHVQGVLWTSEALALPVLVVVVFLGSLAIGIRSVVPVEEARRRQLEFAADASHELRTPLAVIGAELSLARSSGSAPVGFSQTLARVGEESERLERIVDDLLWLARFDAEPVAPSEEPIDLVTIAEGCVERFAPLAAAHGVDLSLQLGEERSVSITAPPEWIDRLAGVLVDNACRYTGAGGTVEVLVAVAGSRATLAIEDSGPGLAVADRERLFDRFRRGSDQPGGHGLGLAIADSVVRSTGGRWKLGESSSGGAHMEVSWPLA